MPILPASDETRKKLEGWLIFAPSRPASSAKPPKPIWERATEGVEDSTKGTDRESEPQE